MRSLVADFSTHKKKSEGDLAAERAWRDRFLGLNNRRQDMALGLDLARSSVEQIDAQWLVNVFPSGAPATPEQARDAFLEQGEDGRSLCFAAAVTPRAHPQLVVQAAALGYPLAVGLLAGWRSGDERTALAQEAARLGDAYGHYYTAEWLWRKGECAAALQHYGEAARLGDAHAMFELAVRGHHASSEERYHWLGRAAAGEHYAAAVHLLYGIRGMSPTKGRGSGSRALFAIGVAVRQHFDVAGRRLFGMSLDSDSDVADVQAAIALCGRASEAARRAVMTWMLVARHNRVVPDVRRLLSKKLWADRAAWSERA